MITHTITLSGTPLSVSFSGTLEQLHQAILAGITGVISSDRIITGQIGGTMPASNIGPWLNGGVWYVFSGGTYVPATIAVGDGTFQITLSGTPTANRAITLQDRDGTLALTSDIYIPRLTVNPTMNTAPATSTIDWSLSGSFAFPLDRNISIVTANSVSGQEVYVAIHNGAGLTYTVTWPADIHWPSGVAPTQSTNGKTDLYILRNAGGQIYGQHLANYT